MRTLLSVSILALVASMSTAPLAAQSGAVNRQDPKPKQDPRGALIARVGVYQIREGDVVKEVNRLIPLISYHKRVPKEKVGEYRKMALDNLVDRALIHQDAVARGLQATEKEIRAEFEKTLKRAGREFENVSPERFDQMLAQYRPRVIRRILIDKNEARFHAALPKVEPEALKRVYDRILAHQKEVLMSPPSAHLKHIFFKVDPSAVAKETPAKRARAEAAAKLLAAGKSFAEVARLYSEDEYAKKGGDLGVVQQGAFKSTKIDRAAFALAAGETSPVLKSLHGFHILRCVSVVPRRVSPLDEVKPMLTSWVEKEHLSQAREAWFAKMRAKFEVKILRPLESPGSKDGAAKAGKHG